MKGLKDIITENLNSKRYTWMIYSSNKKAEPIELDTESGVYFQDARAAFSDGISVLKNYDSDIYLLEVIFGSPNKEFEDKEIEMRALSTNGKIEKLV